MYVEFGKHTEGVCVVLQKENMEVVLHLVVGTLESAGSALRVVACTGRSANELQVVCATY